MAGAIKLLDSASLIDADRTTKVDGNAGHRAARFIVDVTAITRTTGTLVIGLYWSPDGTVAGGLKIAEVTGLTAAGAADVPLVAPFAAVNGAVPEPNIVLWDLVGDTADVSGVVYAIYGD